MENELNTQQQLLTRNQNMLRTLTANIEPRNNCETFEEMIATIEASHLAKLDEISQLKQLLESQVSKTTRSNNAKRQIKRRAKLKTEEIKQCKKTKIP